jgi:hypothetical protein
VIMEIDPYSSGQNRPNNVTQNSHNRTSSEKWPKAYAGA